jgi:hypothetical protein
MTLKMNRIHCRHWGAVLVAALTLLTLQLVVEDRRVARRLST